ncbi:MAG: cytidine deaminase [Bacteroidales bacterium]
MVRKNLTIHYLEYESIDKLEKSDEELLEKAIEACKSSYAPYSKFNVGASVRMSNGKIVSASNQENAAYPSGLCAERVTAFYASAKYPDECILEIAIVASVEGKLLPEPTYPCGACRQVLAEYENKGKGKIKVILGSAGKIEVFSDISSLMPFIFSNLPK